MGNSWRKLVKWLNDEDENDDEDDRMESKMTTKIDED